MLWLGFALVSSAPASGLPPGVVYCDPLPSSRLVSNRTGLLIRFDRAVAPSAGLGTSLTVRGSFSGPVPGGIERLENGRLLRFTPQRPWAAGETVTVTLSGSLLSEPGGGTGRFSYRFEVASERPVLPAAARARLQDLPNVEPPPEHRPWPLTTPADTLPLGFPAIVSSVTGATSPGRIFLASFPDDRSRDSYLLILDDDGRPVFYRPMPSPCFDFKAQPNGELTYFNSGTGRFYFLDHRYEAVDSIQCADSYLTDPHELRVLPDGHVLLLGDDPEVVDMSGVVPGGRADAVVTGIIVQELDGTGAPVFQWRSWDHYQITDATHEDLTAPTIDYVHANAIEVDADGNLLLSCRHMDEITKIDRTTGEVLWRWGGKHNQYTFLGDTLAFSHQHAVRLLQSGDYVLFDNGNFHNPPFSRAVEYQLDQTAMTARLVWQYRAAPDIFGGAMGDVQRLADGNTLIGWGIGKPDVVEVTPEGRPVLTLSLADGLHSYRAYRLDWATADSEAAPLTPPVESLTANRPNPFRRTTDLVVNLTAPGFVSFRVFDLAGREVESVIDHAFHNQGIYRARVDLTGRPAGVYYCRLAVGERVMTRAIVLAP